VSYGISVRAGKRDADLIGIANGGNSRSVNEDDGDLNFERNKPFANVFKATMETELKWRNFGFFGRGTAFYDFDLTTATSSGPRARTGSGQTWSASTASSTRLRAEGQEPARARGRQVISWGESTFIANGINVINPVDLSKIRIPGSELKEAFIPTTGIWGS
jgi:hypothetical protein